MKAHGLTLPLTTFALGFALIPTQAQEALRQLLATERFAEQTRYELDKRLYNARVGQWKLLLGASMGVEWNDNVNYSTYDRQADLLLRPMLNFRSSYPIGQRNSLNISTEIGYEKFLDHSQYDHAVIRPGSALSFDIYLKDFKLNLHDYFSYEQDPGQEAQVANLGKFGGFQNNLGAALSWELQNVAISGGYDYSIFISSAERYEYLNRGSHQFFLRGGVKVHPTAVVGLEATVGLTDYTEPVLNHNVGYSFGTYATWAVTDYLKIQPRLGYVTYTFTQNGFLPAAPTTDGYYFGLQLNHRLHPRLSYSLDGGKSLRYGVYANLVDEWIAHLSLNWGLAKNLTLFTGLDYASGEDVASFFTQQFDQYRASFGLGYRMFEALTVRVDYRLLLRNANYAYGEYTQNRLGLTVSYRY